MTISGGGAIRVFDIDSGVTASLTDLTITGGRRRKTAAVDWARVTLTDDTISGNYAGNTTPDVRIRRGSTANAQWRHGRRKLRRLRRRPAEKRPDDAHRLHRLGNSAGDGSGVYSKGTVTLAGCTVSGNGRGALDGGGRGHQPGA